MGWWQVSADTLAGSRFVISPLAEATASLIALERGTAAHPGERAWLDAHLPGYRERLASDPVTALLVRAALGRHWIADFFTSAPTGEGEPTLGEDLARIREKLPEVARADLTISLGRPTAGQPAPVRSARTCRGPAGLGVAGDGAALLAAATANPGGRYRRADQPAEPRRLDRGACRYAPGDAVAGAGPPADQRVQLPAAEDRRGSVAVRPGHPGPRLGLLGRNRTGMR